VTTIGRQRELDSIARGLHSANTGKASVLALSGPPGSGKSALLADASRLAENNEGRFITIRATGIESESHLSFAGLVSLLHPVQKAIAALHPTQRKTIESALTLGPPSSTADTLALGAAVLQYFAVLSEQAPLLVLIDDLQWLDQATANALLFAIRRLDADQVFTILTWRDGFHVDPYRITEMQLGPLQRTDSIRLLERHNVTNPAVADAVASRCADNPLAIIEVAANLSERQRRGLEPLGKTLWVGRAAEDLFRRPILELSSDERLCVLIAALSQSERRTQINMACRSAGVSDIRWDHAERLRLVSVSANRLALSHPLARAACIQVTEASEHRKAHIAIAETLPPGDERTRHLADAATEPDQALSDNLAAIAVDQLSRGDPTSATAVSVQSAMLATDPASASERWLLAAQCAALAGLNTTDYLDRAEQFGDGKIRAETIVLRGALASWHGDLDASDRVRLSVKNLESSDRIAAAIALSFVASADWNRGDIHSAAATARAAWKLCAERADLPDQFGLMPFVGYVTFGGFEDGSNSRDKLDLCASLIEAREQYNLATPLVTAMLVAGRPSDGLTYAERLHSLSAAKGDVASTAWLSTMCGFAAHRVGDLSGARRWLESGIDLGRLGNPFVIDVATAQLAQIAALEGAQVECKVLLDYVASRQPNLSKLDKPTQMVYSYANLLLLHLSADFVTLSQQAQDLLAQPIALTEFCPAAYELVEALVSLGQLPEAQTLQPILDELEHSRVIDHRGQVQRCRALLAEGTAKDSHFQSSLTLLHSSGRRLELGKTHLFFGEHLRRIGARADAREQLQNAYAIFETAGAKPWAERARRELRASGVRVETEPRLHHEGLTPQESQVAHAAASGLSTRDIATMLFLSPRTVEMHLSQVYRKLGVKGRRELAPLFRRTSSSTD
jgi:DNA-binding CsgD family transcriptional regulator